MAGETREKVYNFLIKEAVKNLVSVKNRIF